VHIGRGRQEGSNMSNLDIARAAIVKQASQDEHWQPGDEHNIYVLNTIKPEWFRFAIAGTFGSDYGCIVIQDGKAEIHDHEDSAGAKCSVCGWDHEQ
jgi:hypothetical protein